MERGKGVGVEAYKNLQGTNALGGCRLLFSKDQFYSNTLRWVINGFTGLRLSRFGRAKPNTSPVSCTNLQWFFFWKKKKSAGEIHRNQLWIEGRRGGGMKMHYLAYETKPLGELGVRNTVDVFVWGGLSRRDGRDSGHVVSWAWSWTSKDRRARNGTTTVRETAFWLGWIQPGSCWTSEGQSWLTRGQPRLIYLQQLNGARLVPTNRLSLIPPIWRKWTVPSPPLAGRWQAMVKWYSAFLFSAFFLHPTSPC